MFITLEGPEGSGKTSQIAPLAEYLRQQGYTVLITREPGGTAISEQIRAVIMEMKNQAMSPRTEILLFCAARAQLVEEVIRPALNAGTVVICDRYADSTLAYQGYGHGLDLDFLRRLLQFATGGLWPGLTLLLDIDPADGLGRRVGGQVEWNRMDAYQLPFHERVRAGYLEMAACEPQRWKIVDASQTRETIQTQIREIVLARLTQPAHAPETGRS
jgi:dTMP kinase